MKGSVDFVASRFIDGIGQRNFPEIAIEAINNIVPFELSSIFLYDGKKPPTYISPASSQKGSVDCKNYLKTFHYNPIYQHHIHGLKSGIYLMRDLAKSNFIKRPTLDNNDLSLSSVEEIGYLTNGWPCNLTELNIAINISVGTTLQVCFYRERNKLFSKKEVSDLNKIRLCILASFKKFYESYKDEFGVSPQLNPWESALNIIDGGILSSRERQVVELIAQGKSAGHISGALKIGRETIKTHRKNAYQKLGVTSCAELYFLISRALVFSK
ncbi:response regulator transcription factor [Pseudomonas fluorescens]|uniref:response regulator transcription factor n=1 Tax=Pseudomonas fluorescens TaxID=294 RepID=UPI0009B7EDDC|nr:helix-turn-helix transcriptional regulator [Pseudomonas fluorescens]